MSMTLYEYITQNMTSILILNFQLITKMNQYVTIEPTSKSFYLPACFIRTKFTLITWAERRFQLKIYILSLASRLIMVN